MTLARHGDTVFVVQRALALLPCLLAACRAAPPQQHAHRPLRVALAPELVGLDPHRQTSHGGFSVLANVYEALTAFDDEMRIVPVLAERWESPDDLTWRFHLRRGVRFHDGRPMEAADVVASLERARRSGRSSQGSLATIAELAAPAADVVEVTTTRPNPMLLSNLSSTFVVPRDAPDEITSPIGTGPYRVARYSPGKDLELASWDKHWGRPPRHGTVAFLFEPDPERRLALLARGETDVALRLAEGVAGPAAAAGYRLLFRPAPAARVLALRVDLPPFSDLRVRRAVSLAIDRVAVTRDLLGGRAQPLGQMLPPGIFGSVPDRAAPVRDVATARRLIAETGGVPTLTLDHGAGRRPEARAIADQLGDAGIRVRLRQRDVAALLPGLQAGDSNLLLVSFVYAAGDAIDIFENMLHSRDPERRFGAENRFGYRNPRVDALVEAGAQTRAVEARRAVYQDAMRAASDDLPVIPLWEVPWVYGVRDDVAWNPPAHGWFLAAGVESR